MIPSKKSTCHNGLPITLFTLFEHYSTSAIKIVGVVSNYFLCFRYDHFNAIPADHIPRICSSARQKSSPTGANVLCFIVAHCLHFISYHQFGFKYSCYVLVRIPRWVQFLYYWDVLVTSAGSVLSLLALTNKLPNETL